MSIGSQWGHYLKVSTFGESHGPAVGCVIDGVPAGVAIDFDALAAFLKRRRPGQNAYTSPRAELDAPKILSGVHDGVTIGSPIAIVIENLDTRPGDYKKSEALIRPSHADYTYFKKYGQQQLSGSGRASARETVGRVAAAAIAKQIVTARYPQLEVLSWVDSIGLCNASVSDENLSFENIEASPLRCPNPQASAQMEQAILDAKQVGDTLGGVVSTRVTGVPVGWGEPVFNKCEALLAHAMLSLPATKGFEIGSGFQASRMKGSDHNDPFEKQGDNVVTTTNHSGGVQGGITNGMPIVFRVGFKPTSTVFREQQTLTTDGNKSIAYTPTGRHDPCVVPRAVPIVEAMTWLVLCDLMLAQTIQESFHVTR